MHPAAFICEVAATDIREILDYMPKSEGQLLTGRILVNEIKSFIQGGSVSSLILIDEAGQMAALADREAAHNAACILLAEGVSNTQPNEYNKRARVIVKKWREDQFKKMLSLV